MNYQ
jgi:hypothetical protein